MLEKYDNVHGKLREYGGESAVFVQLCMRFFHIYINIYIYEIYLYYTFALAHPVESKFAIESSVDWGVG